MTLQEMEQQLNSMYDIASERKDEIIADKDTIKYRLCNDIRIRKLLHNVDIDPEDYFVPEHFDNLKPADVYLDVNIFSYLWVPTTQQTVHNMICFDVENINVSNFGEKMTSKQVTFFVLTDQKDLKVADYGFDRHDMLGYVIRDLFNWSNCLGVQISQISSKVEILDNGYYCRVIKFASETTRGMERGSVNAYD